MSVSTLKNLMISKINSSKGSLDESSPSMIHSAISESITEYINSNVKLVGSYSGVTPAGTPESAPVDTWNIVGSMPPLSVPDDLSSWILEISNGIKSSFYTGLGISHPLSPMISFPLINIEANMDELMNSHLNNYEDPQDASINTVCEWIVNGLTSGFIKEVPAGISGTGVFSVSSIIT